MASEGWGEQEIGTGGRSTIKNKERDEDGGVKITPTPSHRYFAKLRSPRNGVPDWCGEAPAVNHKPNKSFECHPDISLL